MSITDKTFLIDVERKKSEIVTFEIKAKDLYEASQKATELAFSCDWPWDMKKSVSILYGCEKEKGDGIPE